MSISSKEVKKLILEYDNLGQLDDYIDVDFRNTIIGIFNALFILLKNYDKNIKLIDYLLSFLESIVSVRNVNELKLLIGPIIDLQNKVSSFKLRDRIKIKNVSYRVQNIFNNIQGKISNQGRYDQIRGLEFLIFYDKNLNMIKNFLKSHDSVLDWKNQDGEYIFELIIQKYIQCSDENNIRYLYQVILSFLHSKYGDAIIDNKEKYLGIIYSSSMYYKEHVVRLIKLFNVNFSIDRSDFERLHDIYFEFPDALLEEVNTFQEKKRNRIDFSDLECITIDGVNSLCLDDALSIRKNKDGTYRLFVHIADIASIVPYFSMVREEAFLRGETLYLRDDSVLLYPARISRQMCSLLPNNYRNTITYSFGLDTNYKIIPGSFSIDLSKIKVSHRLTYDEVDARLKRPLGEGLDDLLLILANFSLERRKDTLGKEIYREYENLYQFDDFHESIKVDSSIAANIVHESMILVNYQIAKYFKDKGYPYIYRSLYVPSDDFLNEQVKKMKQLGTNIGDNKIFYSELRDSYVESRYCSSPVYHAGLKLECYSHSSSPLRRYMDSLGQFIIHDLVIDSVIDDKNIYTWEYRIQRAIQYANEKKQRNEIFSREYNYLSYKKLIKKR